MFALSKKNTDINKQNWTTIPKNNECVAGTSKEQQKGQQVFEWLPTEKGEHRMKTLSVDIKERTGTKKMSGYSWELNLYTTLKS
jgi:hypothetical protein